MTTPVARPIEVVVVTGMSGAGRSTVANVMEDLGWYVIDNLPLQLLASLIDLTVAERSEANTTPSRVAIVVDVRARGFTLLRESLAAMRQANVEPQLVFLDATDEALVRRFESVRRPHPLQAEGRLLDGIVRERSALAEVRAVADLVVDTSGLNVHQLSAKLAPLFARSDASRVRLAVVSFGFKYGVPLDADFVFDMRFLPNPFWVTDLREHNGTEEAVVQYVLGQPGARQFLEAARLLCLPVTAGYQREARRYATVAVGCTGGKHRSVAMAEALATALESSQVATFVVHRDLGRE